MKPKALMAKLLFVAAMAAAMAAHAVDVSYIDPTSAGETISIYKDYGATPAWSQRAHLRFSPSPFVMKTT